MGMLAVTKNQHSLNAHPRENESINFGVLIQWNAIEQLKGMNELKGMNYDVKFKTWQYYSHYRYVHI